MEGPLATQAWSSHVSEAKAGKPISQAYLKSLLVLSSTNTSLTKASHVAQLNVKMHLPMGIE